MKGAILSAISWFPAICTKKELLFRSEKSRQRLRRSISQQAASYNMKRGGMGYIQNLFVQSERQGERISAWHYHIWMYFLQIYLQTRGSSSDSHSKTDFPRMWRSEGSQKVCWEAPSLSVSLLPLLALPGTVNRRSNRDSLASVNRDDCDIPGEHSKLRALVLVIPPMRILDVNRRKCWYGQVWNRMVVGNILSPFLGLQRSQRILKYVNPVSTNSHVCGNSPNLSHSLTLNSQFVIKSL
jgi:hypothetical protein